MRARNPSGWRNIDWATFSTYLGLIIVGCLMVYTLGSDEGSGSFLSTPIGKQAIWIALSFLVFAVVFLIDWKFWQTFAYLIYVVALLLLVAVLFLGQEIKGATSWFSLGPFSFQPSELAKFATCLALSSYLGNYATNLKTFKSQLYAFGLILTPIALILLQPDAGSALVFLSFFVVLYREGLSPTYYVVGIFFAVLLILGLMFQPEYVILALVLFLSVFLFNQFKEKRRWLLGLVLFTGMAIYLSTLEAPFPRVMLGVSAGAFLSILAGYWIKSRSKLAGLLFSALISGAVLTFAANYAFNNILQPHQQERINVWLRPDRCDPRGSLYNVLQSKMAISSGGITGKGLFQGTMTKLNYVPEQTTDFVFCTIGEEHGFVGSFSVIALFLLLIFRLTILAERQRSHFSRVYIYGVAGIFFIHYFINIGMTMGIMPIIGIPLPFISKGGSSLLGFTLMLAVLLKLDSNRYRI